MVNCLPNFYKTAYDSKHYMQPATARFVLQSMLVTHFPGTFTNQLCSYRQNMIPHRFSSCKSNRHLSPNKRGQMHQTLERKYHCMLLSNVCCFYRMYVALQALVFIIGLKHSDTGCPFSTPPFSYSHRSLFAYHYVFNSLQNNFTCCVALTHNKFAQYTYKNKKLKRK